MLRKRLKRKLNNQYLRDDFVVAELEKLPHGALILDAGAGSQRYRRHCRHLEYRAQDFGQFCAEERSTLVSTSASDAADAYAYGELDYVGDITAINERSNTFDAILCTEVLEHVPYPVDAINELARLLKPGGVLILTAPSNCLRHQDPYFFSSGYADHWYETVLGAAGMEIVSLDPVGDYYSWMTVELARSGATHSIWAKLMLLPAYLWFSRRSPTVESTNTLCMGYHVKAQKRLGRSGL